MVKNKFPAVFAVVLIMFACLFGGSAFADNTDREQPVKKTQAGAYSVLIADYDNCLTAAEETALLEMMKDASKSVNLNIGIVITKELGGRSDRDYTESFCYANFGYESDSIVLMLLNSYNDPKYSRYDDWITTNGKAKSPFKSKSEIIFDEIYNAMGNPVGNPYAYNEITKTYGGYDYSSACEVFVKCVKAYGTTGFAAIPTKIIIFATQYMTVFVIAVLVSVIIAFVIITSVTKKYKTKKTLSASNYINRNETVVTRQVDMFVREYTTRTVHSSSSHSHGGHHGGGHHGGGHHGGGHHSGGGGGRHR